ncbi:MAG: tetratricopeptide repeat protein [Planctomycetota bacterium]|nr:tetratricopeptide repeat protein [Planctomycetota bacterium]
MKTLSPLAVTLTVVLALAWPVQAADEPKTIALKAKAVGGADIAVPQADKPTVLLFARPGQEQSVKAVESLKNALKDAGSIQVVVVLSGEQLADAAGKLLKDLAWPVVMDADYEIVGSCRVHVWPTTLIVSPQGAEMVHLAGLPQTYARDLAAWVAFATKKIDRAALDKQLATTDVIVDSHQQQAGRHLQVAQQLLEKGLADQARAEIDQGLKLAPDDARLLLLSAKAMLLQKDAAGALAAAEKLEGKALPASQLGTIKGAALVALKQPDKAIGVLTEALKLNPTPMETYYFLGLAYQQKGKTAEAAAAFRTAFEHTGEGRSLADVARGATAAGQ